MDELNTLIKSCEHVEALEASKKHLTSAVMVMKAFGNTSSSKPAVLNYVSSQPKKRKITSA